MAGQRCIGMRVHSDDALLDDLCWYMICGFLEDAIRFHLQKPCLPTNEPVRMPVRRQGPSGVTMEPCFAARCSLMLAQKPASSISPDSFRCIARATRLTLLS